MRRRCPRSRPAGPARLIDFALTIALPKKNPPGPGWATVSPRQGSAVPGALFHLHPDDLDALDDFEGWPDLYLREKRPVESGGEIRPALLYRMREPLRPARPSPAYAETLRTGYRDFTLPEEVLDAALREAEAAG